MERTEIEEKVKVILIEEMEIDEDKVYDESRLKDDMGIDSLDYIDIIVIVDKTFGFKIKPEEMSKVKTFKDFCDYIEEKIA
ncbi:MAG: acyl carrier protein [Bacteroidaceae bacterium]|nr:acyl carrier protein [Bacteroidaceae bacterium]